MPTYEYLCPKCEHRFELFHSIKDETPKRCPKCKAKARRVPAGGAGLLFKGSGFYITDYRSASYKASAKQESTKQESTKQTPTPAKQESPGKAAAKPDAPGSAKKPPRDAGGKGAAGGSAP